MANDKILLALDRLLSAQRRVDGMREEADRIWEAAEKGFLGASKEDATAMHGSAHCKQQNIDAVVDAVLRL